MLDTVDNVIKQLKFLDKNELIAVTWWTAEDFPELDTDEALQAVDDAMDNCIGHVNDQVYMEVEPLEEDEE